MHGIMPIVEVYMLFILTAASSSAASKVYGLRGGSIDLKVEPPGAEVTSIIWKYGKDKAAEWFKEDGDAVTYFGKFYSKAVLNKTTWSLQILDLQSEFSGIYSAEVNNKDPTSSLTLEVIGAVSNTEIQKDCTPDNCTLTCTGMGEGPLTYTWYNDKGDDTPGPVLTVQRDKEKDQVYTCKLSNTVSEENRKVTIEKAVVESQTEYVGKVIASIGGVILLVILLPVIMTYILLAKKKGKCWNELQLLSWTDVKDAWSFLPCINGAVAPLAPEAPGDPSPNSDPVNTGKTPDYTLKDPLLKYVAEAPEDKSPNSDPVNTGKTPDNTSEDPLLKEVAEAPEDKSPNSDPVNTGKTPDNTSEDPLLKEGAVAPLAPEAPGDPSPNSDPVNTGKTPEKTSEDTSLKHVAEAPEDKSPNSDPVNTGKTPDNTSEDPLLKEGAGAPEDQSPNSEITPL